MNRTSAEVLGFYKEQLKKFKILGLGKKTEFGTVVTERLINITKKRYMELASRRLSYNKQEPRSNGSI
tara:strand:+ start:5215 stop:5418 length:204 start_codon:yes stop_codon:yes gene_type:complete